ncbi:hypothetical protein ACFPOG_12415 [Paenibacillus aestuarii]|uniref:DUF4145 domain-containing protein n=1 Tax=Paenibacillus aestuarii TaxID=516965 RepID=A0ABW0K6X7_9BACL
MSTVQFNLFNNGIDFLRRGLNEFLSEGDPSSEKYSALHIATAVELILKERLMRINPGLIYKNPGSNFTVTVDDAIKRLNDNGVQFDQNHLNSISVLKDLRNQLIHFQVTYNIRDLSIAISNCLEFIHNFLLTELQVDLKTIAESEDWLSLIDRVNSIGNHYVEEALKNIEQIRRTDTIGVHNKDIDAYCPRCNTETMLINELQQEYPKWSGHCLICGLEAMLTSCQFCSTTIIDYYGSSEVCNVCSEKIFGRKDIFNPYGTEENIEKLKIMIQQQRDIKDRTR